MSALRNSPPPVLSAQPDRGSGPVGTAPVPSVVVIDDDVAVDESFGQMLRAAGYAPHAEADCRSGLTYLETARPSVLILDLHLPDESGLVCLRRIRAIPAHRSLPVAILTGDYFLDEDVARELNALGARVFFKPVWEEDLIRIVEQLLAARRDEPRDPPAGGRS